MDRNQPRDVPFEPAEESTCIPRGPLEPGDGGEKRKRWLNFWLAVACYYKARQ